LYLPRNDYEEAKSNMSDLEDDIDDQLLELAGATEKKKRRRQPSGGSGNGPSKKRRAE
jgi:RNA polymerase-associated protein RTF1